MTTSTQETHRVGMDLAAPWAVYLDGELVAEHATEELADDRYSQLVAELRAAKAARA